MKTAKAMVLTGFGLNCDYETDHALKLVGAESRRVHINELIKGDKSGQRVDLSEFHLLVFDGGFSWGDDHGAGVVMATRFRSHLGRQLDQFIADGKLIMGICNGFQVMVNLGLLPGLDGDYHSRTVALIPNDSGIFRDDWIYLAMNTESPCVFTNGLEFMPLPVRHGEGKLYASPAMIDRLKKQNLTVCTYARPDGNPANGQFPFNPNGSLADIAGICDPTGRIFGLMPHPEAYNHWTNHPTWTRTKETLKRQGLPCPDGPGDGIKIFSNAVNYIRTNL
ncbi:MAG: phosphoribosylformylglycinamidine synthase subunit PurQ [Deltaproteobacteria bacterium]|nr:phosphoribosylformylglycinamidine synthase subunit PurQ [Deltaproteobacteria bacterium]